MHQSAQAQVSPDASVDLCAIAIGLNRRERRGSLPSRLRGSGHDPVIDLTKEIPAGQVLWIETRSEQRPPFGESCA